MSNLMALTAGVRLRLCEAKLARLSVAHRGGWVKNLARLSAMIVWSRVPRSVNDRKSTCLRSSEVNAPTLRTVTTATIARSLRNDVTRDRL